MELRKNKMFNIHRIKLDAWEPSGVVALATSVDGSWLAVAREDGSLEIWLVSPGSVEWHCQLTINGKVSDEVSSLIWCVSSTTQGRLFSSALDGSISEWDLLSLEQKIVLDPTGVPISQIAAEPIDEVNVIANGYGNGRIGNGKDDNETSESDEEGDDFSELHKISNGRDSQRVAAACDDGYVRIYVVTSGSFTYQRSYPRVSGKILSVAWSHDANQIFCGSNDGFIRCWNSQSAHEVYRIAVGKGGSGVGLELCVFSLTVLRCGTLVSGDSTGSVQFWETRHGTLLQAHSYHKGHVNALATAANHNIVFSAGSDGQVILYKLVRETLESSDGSCYADVMKKWVYMHHIRFHTHDIRSLAVALPIVSEDPLPNEKSTKIRCRESSSASSYRKWAHVGVPMLISAGNDTKLFAYPAKEFTQFAPHDICPAPQRASVQLVLNTAVEGGHLILAQCRSHLNVLGLHLKRDSSAGIPKTSTTKVLRKASRTIICSTISSNGLLLAYSNHKETYICEFRCGPGESRWIAPKKRLPYKLPHSHCMIFSADSTLLVVAGHDRKIYVFNVKNKELLHTFIPFKANDSTSSSPSETPMTKMFISSDGQWLATINCFGDVYVFNLKLRRQHWFIFRLNGASVTAGGFLPTDCKILVLTTSSNQIYLFDVEEKELAKWSKEHTLYLPKWFQEFPGEVIGLSFPPSSRSTSFIVYSARAMCLVDLEMPADDDEGKIDPDGLYSSKGSIGKRKWRDPTRQLQLNDKKFSIRPFRDPVLFAGHLSDDSLLILSRPWMEVIEKLGAPVHRHIFGT